MSNNTRLTTAFLILGMVAAAPLAFAQSATATDEATAGNAQARTPPAADATQQAQARSATPPPGTSWESLDTDGNGTLSKDEAQRHEGLARVFAEVDVDANGELTADEYRTFAENQQALAARKPQK